MTTNQIKTLNDGLYAAATKAGMVHALRAAHVEIVHWGAEPVVFYEREVEEAGVRIDYSAIKRAEVWLAARLAKGGV